MLLNKIGMIMFLVGVFFLLVHTTLPFLWHLAGISAPYPLIANTGIGAFLPGFTPPIGALLMTLGGMMYGKKQKEAK
jgi:hypothetical protein